MSKKITVEEFSKRFSSVFPTAEFEVVKYTAISHPCSIKCLKCGRVIEYSKGNQALSTIFCCTTLDRITSIKERLNENYEFIKYVDKDNIIIKHKVCGNEQTRAIQSAFKEPNSCKLCEGASYKNMLSIEEIQKRLDGNFLGIIKIIEYTGILTKNKYKCNKCGLIFTKDQTSMMASRGCPKCDSNKSKGEIKLAEYLKSLNLNYKEQVKFKELPLQSFDFAVFDKNDKLLYLIECQGEQHYKEVEVFRDGFEKIKERDERKRNFCKKYNITLYEIPYIKGVLKDLNKLPF